MAKEAGVSQATVSYVLNNVEGISIKPKTREAVLNAARKLNYHPNLIAKSMRLKKSMSIGIVTDKDVSNYFFMNILEGIKDALVHRNYTMTFCFNKYLDLEEDDYVKYYNSNRIDGIIFTQSKLTDMQISYLLENNIPFVVINTNARNEVVHLVKTDMEDAIGHTIGCFADSGIKDIAYIGTNAKDSGNRRYQGYIKGLEKCGLKLDENIVYKVGGGKEETEKLMDAYFPDCKAFPAAVICDHSDIGFYMLRHAVRKGVRVPNDMTVVSIGTSPFFEYSQPAMSAIEAPLYDMGYKGCSMLFDIMDGNSDMLDDVVVLQWKLVRRESF